MRSTPLVAGLVVSAAIGHVGYPIALAAVARRRQPAPRVDPAAWPAVTVLVPAYLEAGVIGAKVADVHANGYPGPLEVLVVADGDPETAAKAAAAGARVELLPERRGKSQALNHGVAAASHEMVVISDANNELEQGAIAHLVRRLSEDGVGAVAGEKLEGTGGELAYWRFEAWLKRNEDLMGTTLGLDGGLCAVRRSTWPVIPTDISNDDLWVALDLMERGLRVAYEPQAVVREDSIGGTALSWERRTRVLGGGLWVMWRKRQLLDPRRGFVSAQIWGHKLWRSTIGPLSHLALLLMAVRSAPGSLLARLFLAGHAVGAASFAAQQRDVRLPLPARLAAQVLYLQAVAFGGMARCLRGDRVLQWAKPAR
ncbi:glycosyltransferase [Modestobacter sp. I12A-02628]|uniref:Glycosyltransferase n=1 Tax=Goekera deserti TaxID=2497753 RepID=A0A7K3WF49_9ACTN|nr:glycosyltransferase [Goekera deserti]MPQ97943.1 glycosyltransferase [Goekera deserti]NDI48589.1 glycosyltransferase [Goekera deserti]NEL55032.1 glycosyltransferase [Goekera deserti]